MRGFDITMNQLPLKNIKVLEAASIIAGPKIGMHLADFGAEVIKVEHPKYGDSIRNLGHHKDGCSLEWKHINRNKKPITLNLSKEKGKDIFLKLIKDSDILIENFRPGTMEKWGLGWEVVSKINPKLIMIRVSGFGQDGPYNARPGFGTLAEAMSGFASINGYSDRGPLLPSFALADQVTALVGAYSAMVAYYHQKTTGEGQYIDLSIYESLMAILGNQVMDYDQLGIIQKRMGNRMAFSVPRNLYETKDEKWIAMSGSAQSIVERLFIAMERKELIEDPRFKDNTSRQKYADELDEIIGDWMGNKTQKEVLDHLIKHEVAVAPVYGIDDLFNDEHVQSRENIVSVKDDDLGKVKMQNIVPKLSLTPGEIRHTGLDKGEYNDQIYAELGYSEEDIQQFKSEDVI